MEMFVPPNPPSDADKSTATVAPYSDPGILHLINIGVYDRDVECGQQIDLNTGFLPVDAIEEKK